MDQKEETRGQGGVEVMVQGEKMRAEQGLGLGQLEGRLNMNSPCGEVWVGGTLEMLMTGRKVWECENICCVPEMANHPGWWGLGFEAREIGDVAGKVGHWNMALGPEYKAEALDLDPEGLEKRKDRVRCGYLKDLIAVHLRRGGWAGRCRDWRPSPKWGGQTGRTG